MKSQATAAATAPFSAGEDSASGVRRRGGFPPRPAVLAGAVVLAVLLPAAAPAQPRAEVVEDEPASLPQSGFSPGPQTSPPRAEVIPDETEPPAPPPGRSPAESAPARPKPDAGASEVRPAGKPAPRAKSAEDDLFDYCELLFSKGDHALAVRQYEEYLKVFPNGKYREEVRFKIAESHYRAQSLDLALMEFDSYLKDFPAGKNRAIVLYHAGECHRIIAGRMPSAGERILRQQTSEEAYRAVLQTTRTGPYAAYAAFRLASAAYNAAEHDPDRYKDAIRYFTIAAAQAPKEQAKIRFASLFFKGRSCKFSGTPKEAAAAFGEVIRVKEDNSYYEKALMELANLDMEAGRQEAAMKKFEQLAAESAAAETRAESMVNAGMIHADAGRTGEAVRLFEEAAKVNGAPLAQARARYGLVFNYFKQKDYPKVIETWRGLGDYSSLDDNTRARLLLIAGTAFSATSQHLRAAEIFGILEQNMPDRPEAIEGGYKRLVSLFKLNDPGLPEAVTAYTERWRPFKPDSDFLDKAMLVRAAYFFNRSIWEQAVEAYQRVREEKIGPDKLASYLYQRGCAEASHGDKEAGTTLTKFITKYPEDPRLSMAILQRGLAAQKSGNLTAAIEDYELIRKKFPKSGEDESAAYRLAQSRGMKQDYAGTVEAFQKLLKDYPQTKVAPEAWYWIGLGLYRQQKFEECVDPLRTAREKDLKTYYTDATLMIIGALTMQKDVDHLMPEVDGYLKGTQEKKISPDILRWLGHTVYAERRNYRAASRYLSLVVNYEDPRATPPEIWGMLGESQVENGSYESGLVALDHQLASEERPAAKVKAWLSKGRAFHALGRMEEATKSVEAGLDLDKETLTSASLRILLGDIAMAGSRFNEAISSYGVVVHNWEDPTITPTAMARLIEAYIKSGDPDNRTKAEKVKEDLARRFPRFQVKASTPDVSSSVAAPRQP